MRQNGWRARFVNLSEEIHSKFFMKSILFHYAKSYRWRGVLCICCDVMIIKFRGTTYGIAILLGPWNCFRFVQVECRRVDIYVCFFINQRLYKLRLNLVYSVCLDAMEIVFNQQFFFLIVSGHYSEKLSLYGLWEWVILHCQPNLTRSSIKYNCQ